MSELEKNLQYCQDLYDEHLSTENMKKLEILKMEYDTLYGYITQGAMVRSRAKWYKQGEKSNKYLVNVENVNAIPGLWRSDMKENVFIPPSPFNENSYCWSIKGDMVDTVF